MKKWTWVKVAAVTLKKGRHAITLTSSSAGAQADLICLATDPAFTPKGVRPEDRAAPRQVQGLKVAKVRGRAVHLKWQTSPEPDFFHYNVYAARKPLVRPQQRHLVASPTYGEFIAWGLRPGTTYYYAVTAVDRRGNESSLGAVVKAAIPRRAYRPQEFELRFDQAKLHGKFKRARAQGTHAREYVILPAETAKKDVAEARVSWRINLKHGGKYHFWLRYLPVSPSVNQHLKVFLGDKHVTTLGGGQTGLNVPDEGMPPEFWNWADRFWTWARPVDVDLIAVDLPAGRHTLTLRNLAGDVRYDALFITDEPSFAPGDGRLRQARYR